jgi:hypothetical protein
MRRSATPAKSPAPTGRRQIYHNAAQCILFGILFTKFLFNKQNGVEMAATSGATRTPEPQPLLASTIQGGARE